MDVRLKRLLEFLAAGVLFAAGICGYTWFQNGGALWADSPGAMYLLALPGGAALAGLFHTSADPHQRVRRLGGVAGRVVVAMATAFIADRQARRGGR